MSTELSRVLSRGNYTFVSVAFYFGDLYEPMVEIKLLVAILDDKKVVAAL